MEPSDYLALRAERASFYGFAAHFVGREFELEGFRPSSRHCARDYESAWRYMALSAIDLRGDLVEAQRYFANASVFALEILDSEERMATTLPSELFLSTVCGPAASAAHAKAHLKVYIEPTNDAAGFFNRFARAVALAFSGDLAAAKKLAQTLGTLPSRLRASKDTAFWSALVTLLRSVIAENHRSIDATLRTLATARGAYWKNTWKDLTTDGFFGYREMTLMALAHQRGYRPPKDMKRIPGMPLELLTLTPVPRPKARPTRPPATRALRALSEAAETLKSARRTRRA